MALILVTAPPLDSPQAAGPVGVTPMYDMDDDHEMAAIIAVHLADQAIVADPKFPEALEVLGIRHKALARVVQGFDICNRPPDAILDPDVETS